MREALNQNTLFSTLLLARQNTPRLILVIEGEDDYFVLKKHHNDNDALLLEGKGRGITLETARLALEYGLTGVRFLVDADFDRITQPDLSYSPNVITSTCHDVVMDLVTAGIENLDRVISAHARKEERKGVSIDPAKIRAEAIGLAGTLVPIRTVNETQSMNLTVSGFPFGALKAIPPSMDDVCTLVVQRSYTELSVTLVVAEVENCPDHGFDPYHVVGDHDFFNALNRVLSEYGIRVGSEILFASFLATVACTQIMLTDWYEAISRWGLENNRVIFNCPCAA